MESNRCRTSTAGCGGQRRNLPSCGRGRTEGCNRPRGQYLQDRAGETRDRKFAAKTCDAARSGIMSIIMTAMKTAVRLAPESWLPGGKPDPLMNKHGLIGKPVSRIDGLLKVQGKARFAP